MPHSFEVLCLRCLRFVSDSEGECAVTQLFIEVVSRCELGRDESFPFTWGKGYFRCETEARPAVYNQFVGTDGVAFARFEAADGNAYTGQVAHQLEIVAVDRYMGRLAGGEFVYLAVCLRIVWADKPGDVIRTRHFEVFNRA